jgi:protein-disulfide isomerase
MKFALSLSGRKRLNSGYETGNRRMKRIFVAFLALMTVCGGAIVAEFSDAEKAAIDARVRAYILENPEVLLEAMQVLEQRQQLAQVAADKAMLADLGTRLYDDGFSFVGGDPNGDVTVVEFLDYRCGYCKKAHTGVQALIAGDRNIRFVVKELPILGDESVYASRAAMAAKLQGDDLYEAYSDAMMRHRGDLDKNAVYRLARSVGIDADRMLDDMGSPAIAAQIDQTRVLAREMDIRGTPAFVIGGEIVRGYVPYDTLRQLVSKARSES